ncbi:hypothetical protein FJTKL_10636 [Diaporthe vaccinii]|uniref:Uncharacterized protein n=1 Tax=Diaporthe vaccinii TaxID=105482 RepID=A0ABR4EJI8_9PEZI
MLPSLARKAVSQPSFLLRRRLRHAGLDDKRKRWLARNLGEKIGQIQPESLQPCAHLVTSASGFELLCSYSWRAEPKKKHKKQPKTEAQTDPGRRSARPQIYVPGEAPVAIPHELPFVVTSRSKTVHHRDANVARMPLYPFEPMFQSLSVLNPGFRFDDVDLIINRNSLSHLLRFVNGSVKHNYRLDLAMVHNTLIVTPAWQRVSEINRDKDNHGRDFEDLIVQRRLQDSATYHRAIRYNLGPLNCAVLSELDAALPASGGAMASHNEQWKFHPKPGSVSLRELSDEWQPNTRAEEILFEPRDQTASKQPRLWHQPHSMVILGGTGTLSKDAAELSASGLSGIRKMPQLWFGRVPSLVRGRYGRGSLASVTVTQVAASFADYENRIQDRLQKLVSLIATLKEFAMDATDQRCIAICDKTVQPRELRIFHHHKTPPLPLPADIRRHFWTSNDVGNQDSHPGISLYFNDDAEKTTYSIHFTLPRYGPTLSKNHISRQGCTGYRSEHQVKQRNQQLHPLPVLP